MKKTVIFLLFFLGLMACDDIFEVTDISNNTVELLAPSDNVTLDTSALLFSWTALEDAESYHLQVAVPTFNDATQIIVDTLTSTLNYSTTLDNNTYQWRVRAENSGYQTNYTTQNFTVEN